ncbi:hypothetical protein GJ629_05210 [Halapricum sp. CBA1109]|uniref:alpha-amylase family glycosyl hydrolase n=1 Tax=Halapricum sp. CBA1109 TaxID=2668068 RepID=UPI0012F75308|nr:hypothetical protein [Halapricum sp. CBA1109]
MLTPILESHSHSNPNVPGGPHGYDVTNYFEAAEALGDNEDYEALVEACHERDIKVIFDLVINHSAEEHPYFRAGNTGEGVADGDQEFFRSLYQYENSYTPKTYAYWSGIPRPRLRLACAAVVDSRGRRPLAGGRRRLPV